MVISHENITGRYSIEYRTSGLLIGGRNHPSGWYVVDWELSLLVQYGDGSPRTFNTRVDAIEWIEAGVDVVAS
jgi:hypothetical protein